MSIIINTVGNKTYFLLLPIIPLLLTGACRSRSVRSDSGNIKPDSLISTGDEKIPIHDAALDGNLAIVTMLLGNGIKADTPDQEGRTALMYASFNGHTRVMQKLLQNGASVNISDKNGTTALMMASSGPYPQAVTMLLESGADPDLADQVEHFTALMYAASEGQLEVVKILLSFGANPGLKDIDGDDALTFATKNNHSTVADFLKSYREKIPEN
jgi:ankyrin repeat protein